MQAFLAWDEDFADDTRTSIDAPPSVVDWEECNREWERYMEENGIEEPEPPEVRGEGFAR
jgi:hypothetical protein